MREPDAQARPWTPTLGPGLVFAALTGAAAILTLARLSVTLPIAQWGQAVWSPDSRNIAELLVHFSVLPRLCVALLCGAALGLAGAVFQQVLRNPLAEPATLGVASGAFLALSLAGVWLPDLAASGRQWFAFSGGMLALLAVLGLSARQALLPASTVVAGLLVTLICSSVATAVALFHDQSSASVLLWASGSFDQLGWGTPLRLALQIGPVFAAVIAMARPLALLGLDDGVAKGLGASPARSRLLALLVAVALTGFVVSAVGIVGFVGLAAPAIAWLAGARRFQSRLLWAPLLGAGLLWLADALVQSLEPDTGRISTGAVTTLLAAPLIIWLVPNLRHGLEGIEAHASRRRLRRPARVLAACVLLIVIAAGLSLLVGRRLDGLTLDTWASVQPFLFWRGPRMVAALSAGGVLAVAGALLQRLTGNAMASPELFGISSGAALGLVVLVFCLPSYSAGEQGLAAAIGSVAALVCVMAFAGRSRFAPNQALLVGMAMTSASSAVVAVLLGTGDTRAYVVLRWLSGSTDLATPETAAFAAGGAVATLAVALTMIRWLAILPLGAAVGQELGLDLARVRALALVAAALPTSLATILVGPLSFVGLLAPSIAALLGFSTPSLQLLGAAGIGSLSMLVADWLSRIILFPNQFPAGLLASLIAAPCFVWLLRRRR